MKNLISLVTFAGWIFLLWLGLNGNHGLLMLAKVLSWVIVFTGFMSVNKEVKEELKNTPAWLALVSVVVTVFAGVWLSYDGHWITGSALIISEFVFIGQYFKDRDSEATQRHRGMN